MSVLAAADWDEAPLTFTDAVRLSRARLGRFAAAPIQQPSLIADLAGALEADDDAPDLAGLPDPAPWAARLTLAALEVLAGVRSPAQMVRWTTPEVHEILARHGAASARRLSARGARRRRASQRVRRTLCQTVEPGVAEATVIIDDGPRVRAIAIRLVARHGTWRIEAIEVG